MDTLEKARKIATILESMKGVDIRLLDVSDKLGLTDYFLIASGTSRRLVTAMAGEVDRELRHAGVPKARIEGLGGGWWVLLDFDDLVVHIFRDEARSFYDLESLYADTPVVEWQEPEPGEPS